MVHRVLVWSAVSAACASAAETADSGTPVPVMNLTIAMGLATIGILRRLLRG
jgi:hypothetical protein